MTASPSPTPSFKRKSISLPGDVVASVDSRGGKSHVVSRDLNRLQRLLFWQMADMRSQLTPGLVERLISIAAARQHTPVHRRTTDGHGRVRRVDSATTADVVSDMRCHILADAISNDRSSESPGLLQQTVCNLGDGHVVALVDHAERLRAQSGSHSRQGDSDGDDIHTGSGS